MYSIRKASIDDMETLVQLRVDFLGDGGNVLPPEERDALAAKLRAYFARHFADDTFIAILAEAEGAVVSTAFLAIVERPPREADESFRVGTVYNVYTDPAHRRKGIAHAVMQELLAEARRENLSSVDLFATEAGQPLYEKLGFRIPKSPCMRLQLG